jgi:hypothetical protein
MKISSRLPYRATSEEPRRPVPSVRDLRAISSSPIKDCCVSLTLRTGQSALLQPHSRRRSFGRFDVSRLDGGTRFQPLRGLFCEALIVHGNEKMCGQLGVLDAWVQGLEIKAQVGQDILQLPRVLPFRTVVGEVARHLFSRLNRDLHVRLPMLVVPIALGGHQEPS